MHAVARGQVRHGERVHSFQATDVDPVLVRIELAPMVIVDAADRAETTLGDTGIELMEHHPGGAFYNAQVRRIERRHHRAPLRLQIEQSQR